MEISSQQVFVNGVQMGVPSGSTVVGTGPRVVARFTGPVRTAWRTQLAEAGVRVEFWCPPHGACLTLLDAAAPARLAALDFVAGFVAYDERLCERALPATDAPAVTSLLDVICFSRADRPSLADRLTALGATVVDQSGSKVRVLWPGDPAPVRDVNGVKLVERPHLPAALTSVAGVTAPPAPPLASDPALGLARDIHLTSVDGGWRAGLDGRGEVIGIADTGLDSGVRETLTPDLRDRVAALVSWPLNPSWTPFVTNPGADDGSADTGSGHGTFISGVAAGTGAQSGGARRGVAPGARLVVQTIEQWLAVAPGHPEVGASRFALAGRPTDLRQLLGRAHDLGARVQLLAWGTPASGGYDNDAYEADLFLSEHPETIVVVAAGNDGRDANGDRRIDPGTVNSPATSKNVLAIGATEGSEPNGFPFSWARLQASGRVFANPADLADAVFGQPDRMALLSSTGPTSDGRIRPDLCAPGTCIVGPRSSVAAGRGWGLASPTPHYVIDGGTSAAAAVTAGAAAVIRQAWREARRGRSLSGPSVKALAILGAAPVRTRDGSASENRAVCGFGRLDVDGSLPHPRDGSRIAIWSDNAARLGLQTGGRRRFRIALPRGGRLRAVLCWYDPPNERLLNNLDLSLSGAPPVSTAPVFGNHDEGQPARPGVADRTNPVEVIDATLPAGTWELRVSGANVPQGPQRFSLVSRTWPG